MYLPVVGLEIHIQAKTASKMFCRCSADYFGKDPNVNICPVCFGLPGALPVPNNAAFEKCVKLALALNCSISHETKFDRKNYFYPDLPKGYQISQYDQPIGSDGYVEIDLNGDARRIRLQRVHLEEDTAKSLHAASGDTLIDFNKSGVALIEIVTLPDFESVEEVIAFAKRLRQIVRYLDVSDAEMQKGQMRFELNISVKPDTMPAGEFPDYKVEVKNIGSISVLEKVINFEVTRQAQALASGERLSNQTRGLKGMSGETLFQRSKESADDYRYFPEPDIPPLHISDAMIAELKAQLPELPNERRLRYLELGLEGEQADIFVEDTEKGAWFDALIAMLEKEDQRSKSFVKELAKWTVGEIAGQLERRKMAINDMPLKQTDLLDILTLVKANQISGTIAKDVINQIFETNGLKTGALIITEQNLLQVSDASEVEGFVQQVLAENQKVVADLAKNPNALKFLVGKVMKLSKGKVNPKVAEEELRKKLNTVD